MHSALVGSAATVPSAQAWHAVAAGTPENVDAEHLEQLAEPEESLNVPGLHGSQTPPSGPLYPGLHRQLKLLLPTPESEFSGHPTHDVLPTKSVNVPPPHVMHAEDPFTLL
eukprot:1779353-Rhodomonas_salina.1